jgi:hypothetical protein
MEMFDLSNVVEEWASDYQGYRVQHFRVNRTYMMALGHTAWDKMNPKTVGEISRLQP